MPAKPTWWSRIEEITTVLAHMTTPVIDRRTVEQLFRVKKRRANELMQVFGEFQTANVYLVKRESLIAALHRLREADEIRYELARRKRLSGELVRLDRHARARAIRLPVRPAATAALPSGVFVSPGALIVKYDTAEDLFAKLYGIAEFAAVDFERMRQTVEPHGVASVFSATEMMDTPAPQPHQSTDSEPALPAFRLASVSSTPT